MKPIKLYFSGGCKGKSAKEEVELGVRNKLVSYFYPEQLESWFEISKGIEGSVMIDSGAYSAWTRGVEIDLGKYIEYCQEMIHRGKQEGKEVLVVNLDVIPGKKGQTRSLSKIRSPANISVIEEAAEKGYQNLKKMIKAGLKPIHVFHQGEDWKWLHKMVELTDYIGISPANDLCVDARKKWIVSVFEYMYKHNIEVDTHGFGVWMSPILKSLPFTSCDAVSWMLLAAMGSINYPVGGFSNPDYSQIPHSLHVSARLSSKGLGKLTKEKLKMLEQDGYTYEDLQDWETRCRVNIRYFVEFEKWLNEYRKDKTFRPRPSLL